MHAAIAVLAILRGAAATPSPTGTPAPETVTPGPWGFVVVALLAAVVVLLIWDMLRRIRRARYRAQVREELDAEQAQGAQAARATDADGQDVDASGDDRR